MSKKYKIIGGVVLGVVGINVATMLYLDLPRHIKDLVAEEEANPNQPRKSAHEMLTLAIERAFNEKFGPV